MFVISPHLPAGRRRQRGFSFRWAGAEALAAADLAAAAASAAAGGFGGGFSLGGGSSGGGGASASAAETRAAFSRATVLTAKTDNFADRFATAHFQWTLNFVRGELRSAQELESSFLKEAEDTSRVVEAGVALRGLALACYQAGDFLEARIHCERAIEVCDLDNERETQERFHDATGPIVLSVLAVTMWQLGEVERARELMSRRTVAGTSSATPPNGLSTCMEIPPRNFAWRRSRRVELGRGPGEVWPGSMRRPSGGLSGN